MFFWIVTAGLAGILLLQSNSASANHYIYLQSDPQAQARYDEPRAYRANFTFHRWALGTDGAHWIDESNLSSYIEGVIQDWEEAVPELHFIRETSSPHDLKFVISDCNGANGCYIVDSFLDEHSNQASYVHKATIGIHEDVVYESDTAIKDTLRHELGHFIGLHERYDDSDFGMRPIDPCPPEDTVMT